MTPKKKLQRRKITKAELEGLSEAGLLPGGQKNFDGSVCKIKLPTRKGYDRLTKEKT